MGEMINSNNHNVNIRAKVIFNLYGISALCTLLIVGMIALIWKYGNAVIVGILVLFGCLILLTGIWTFLHFKARFIEIRANEFRSRIPFADANWLVEMQQVKHPQTQKLTWMPVVHERNNEQVRLNIHRKETEVIEEDNTVEALPEPRETPLLTSPSIREEDAFNLGATCKVHADEILSGRGTIIGVSGSGKSNSVAVLCEECGSKDVPLLLADTEDEYPSLKPWFPHGMLLNAENLQASQGKSFGRYLLDNHVQAIVNLQSYEMDEAALLLVKIITGMKEWEEESEEKLSSMVILEEAAIWLPQNPKQSLLHNPATLAALQQIFFGVMVARGRKRGLGLAIAAQRIAELDKRALQSSWKIYHRQTENTDLNLYKESGIAREDAENLRDGEAFISTGRMSRKRVQMRMRYSPHGAKTPGLASIRKHQERLAYQTPLFKPTQPGFEERPDVETVVVPEREMEPLMSRPSNVQTFPKPYLVRPVEPTHTTSEVNEERPKKYLLTNEEITIFIEEYRECGNIDKALAKIGKGSLYREAARRIIKIYNLREEAQ